MTDTTQPGQAEHSLWDDEAMHAAYKGAFETDPDVHHWALLCWIRDDMAQALAAAQERITELEAQLAWKEGLIQQLTNVDMAAMEQRIAELERKLSICSEYADKAQQERAQLAERSEWEQRQQAATQQGQPLDAPDGPGHWAFEGGFDYPDAESFRCVLEVIEKYGEMYAVVSNDLELLSNLTGKWYKLTMPWDVDTLTQRPQPTDTKENHSAAQ